MFIQFQNQCLPVKLPENIKLDVKGNPLDKEKKLEKYNNRWKKIILEKQIL